MGSFTIMPEGCRWTEYDDGHITDAQTVYSLHAHWYKPGTRIAIRDNDNGQTWIFTRTHDENGQPLIIDSL